MSSIYLPDDVKAKLIRAARRRGFEVKQGSRSQLADYIVYLVENDERVEAPRGKKGSLERAIGLLAQSDRPAPTDEEIDQLLHERRMQKYGGAD
jgi:hypothetical protein